MNKSIQRLYETANKSKKQIIGLMSGTSLDGLDLALCQINGAGHDTQLKLKHFCTVSYTDAISRRLEKIISAPQASLQEVCLLHTRLADIHADIVLQSLRKWEINPADVAAIASHGQTLYHAPRTLHRQPTMPNATLQLVDGDHIARKTGILTISDFRQKHTAAGGEGAPMVALIDELLFADATQPRVLLNIGGIANFTYLPGLESSRRVITTDTGPGNTLINQAMRTYFDAPFDDDGRMATRGTVHPELLQTLLQDDFFATPLPRTTGPELLNMAWLEHRKKESQIEEMAPKDVISTLTWLTAQTISDAIALVAGESQPEIYVSGGGRYNSRLIAWLGQLLGQPIQSFGKIGFNPDAKEAACFAVLANELLSGDAFQLKSNAGRRVNFGKISLPI